MRKISNNPIKVLDAPFLQDDYYLNVVDWSQTDNLAVGLAQCVYLWNFKTNKIDKISENQEQNFVSSLSWNEKGSNLAIGSMSGSVQIFDTTTNREIV